MEKIVYAGDSTAAFNSIHSYPQTGMSQGLARYVADEVTIRSFARNGRSTKSFITEGLWGKCENALEAGDLFLIQFGHNDEKDDEARHTDPFTTYQENLTVFVETARKKQAIPVLVTPIARRLFDEAGHFKPGSHGDYPKAVRELGARLGVPVVDLTAITEDYLAHMGDIASKPLFMWPKDNTHLKPEGAVIMAGFLANELSKLGEPYSRFFLKAPTLSETF